MQQSAIVISSTVQEGQWTALMLAAESGDAKVVKTLIEGGANVNAKNAVRRN